MKENDTLIYKSDTHLIKQIRRIGICLASMLLAFAGCTKLEPVVIVITATATNQTPQVVIETTSTPSLTVQTSPNNLPTQNTVATPINKTYVVQAGDTLSGIAAQFGVQLQTIMRINQISDPNVLEIGQVIVLPGDPTTRSPEFKIISDRRFIRGPGSQQFDVYAFVNQQQGYIKTANDIVDEIYLTAADVVKRVSEEFSVDPRLLLAVLQYRSQWLTQTQIDDNFKQFPIQGKPSPDGIDRSGLYKQLSWAANQLNAGYYGWKYKGADTIEFDDGTRLRYAANINAGTVGVQYFLGLQSDYLSWQHAVSNEGLFKTYTALFGDPLVGGDADPLVPNQLQQPELKFPFPSGQTWFFTGGPHGGWGVGSAWSAIDFAPPDYRPDGSAPCYISSFWATAMASGVIARSGGGVVVLDLDGDGDETTGWTIMYLHMASEGRVALGTQVKLGDQIGRPSCEGGFSNATHMHIARRYNGEWIPVDCSTCSPDAMPAPFVMDGWTVEGLDNQEYQGYMVKGNERRDAEQGRLTPINRISW